MADAASIPAAFAGQVDLASVALGGQCLACSDDFFAEVEHLLNPEPAVFDPDAYTERGKEMDGWESRRKRVPGHDWAIIQLGVRGQIRGVDIDTSFFMGNHPPYASLEACNVPDGTSVQTLRELQTWTEIVPSMPLQRGSHNLQAVSVVGIWTHVRLRIHPDGGVARLRVWGDPRPAQIEGEEIDVACVRQGGRAVACSDMFFSPMNNLVLPEPAPNMGGGWETRRSRPPSDDWIVVQLGSPALLKRVVIDTRHFKGNYPDTVAVDALYWPDAPLHELIGCEDWTEIVSRFETSADAAHEKPVEQEGPFTHVRLRIYPDGGVSRLQVHGVPTGATPADEDSRLGWLNSLSDEDCTAAMMRCCGSTRWAERLAGARPFTSWTQVHGLARAVWWALDDADWHEAFTHHPKIGASPEALREKFAATAGWSAGEQAGVEGADDGTIEQLAQGNQDYEARFGYIFIVCASGLTAAEMLEKLENRLPHTPENEIRIAAGQQAMITALRLDKMEIT